MYTLRPATEADYPQIVALINRQLPTPTTLEQYTAAQHRRPAHLPYRLTAAELADGRLAGYGVCGWEPESDPNHFFAAVRVDAGYLCRGIGSALLADLEAWARANGATRLESSPREDAADTLAWAARRGFVEESRVFRAELDLTRWDPTPFEPLLAPALASGLRFCSLAEAGAGEQALQRYHAVCKAWERHVPGRAPRTLPYNDWRRAIAEDPSWDPACVLLAVDGENWAGFTQMDRQPDGSWYTHLTAIDPAYRGRGLGQALKVAAVLMAKRQGVPSLSTFNHTNNGPMVAINEKLGYKPGFTLVQLYKPL